MRKQSIPYRDFLVLYDYDSFPRKIKVSTSMTASRISETAMNVHRTAVLAKGLSRISTAKIRVTTASISATNHYGFFVRSISVIHWS